jgi:hypothetical protein
MGDGLKRRWQRATALSYLSPFERALNRTLWGLAWAALLYGVAQHVFLANTPEVFRGGARLGDLFYDLSIAYFGAFVFYLLVVRLPLLRDRRNIYRHLAPLIGQVVGEAWSLIGMLHGAAGFDNSRENTLANVEETCSKIGPDSEANLLMVTASGYQKYKVMDAIYYHHMERARRRNREILELSSFVPSEVISLITEIENHGYFRVFESVYSSYKAGAVRNTDLSFLARNFFDYLLLADRLDNYRHEFLPTTATRPSYLVSGSNRDSPDIPLKRFP